MTNAQGSFEVTVRADPPLSEVDSVALSQAHVDKRFSGPLEGTGAVWMLGVRTPPPGPQAYVAIERITGTLHGKRGSFCTVHRGAMGPDGLSLVIEILPGTGTGELRGITGTMRIRIEAGGAHFYDVDYAI